MFPLCVYPEGCLWTITDLYFVIYELRIIAIVNSINKFFFVMCFLWGADWIIFGRGPWISSVPEQIITSQCMSLVFHLLLLLHFRSWKYDYEVGDGWVLHPRHSASHSWTINCSWSRLTVGKVIASRYGSGNESFQVESQAYSIQPSIEAPQHRVPQAKQ